jgi:flagellar hook assembly protein FlgD
MLKKQIIIAVLMFIVVVSLFANKNDVVTDITINPNPMEKNTTITITLVQAVRAEIVIESQDGSIVKTFLSGNLNAGTYSYYWNRVGDGGEYVPNGKYNLSINYETRYTSTKKTLILK